MIRHLVKGFQQRHLLADPSRPGERGGTGMQRLRRAVNVVQRLREARTEEPKPLLMLPPTFDVRFLACVVSWTTKSRRRGGRRTSGTPWYSPHARSWNTSTKNEETSTKKSYENSDRIGYLCPADEWGCLKFGNWRKRESGGKKAMGLPLSGIRRYSTKKTRKIKFLKNLWRFHDRVVFRLNPQQNYSCLKYNQSNQSNQASNTSWLSVKICVTNETKTYLKIIFLSLWPISPMCESFFFLFFFARRQNSSKRATLHLLHNSNCHVLL